MRNIPDNNLAYPVLITLDNGSTGSGFLYQVEKKIYFITAKHVIFNSKNRLMIGKTANIICQIDNLESDKTANFQLNFKELADNKKIAINPTSDVAAIEIFDTEVSTDTKRGSYKTVIGVTKTKETGDGAIVILHDELVNLFSDVLVSNDVFLYGYPSSLGLQDLIQFDYNKPLLRKGIVAGLNRPTQTIILDCPAYYGNSGGPVVQVEMHKDFTFAHKVIGVVSEFIPFEEKWVNNKSKIVNTHISNSGYSIAVSMDKVKETIEMLKKYK